MHDSVFAWAENPILERKAAWTIALQQLSTEREYQKIFLETFVSERKTEKKLVKLTCYRLQNNIWLFSFLQFDKLFYFNLYITSE